MDAFSVGTQDTHIASAQLCATGAVERPCHCQVLADDVLDSVGVDDGGRRLHRGEALSTVT